MKLYWRQSLLAWLAFHPDHAEELGDPLSQPVDASVQGLCVRLLKLGGTRVAVQFGDAWACWWIARDGQLVGTDGLTKRRGKVNHCHSNCAAIWEAKPNRYRIQTGFALSEGVWRRHSWLLDRHGRVVETTFPNEHYFGVILDAELARFFVQLAQAS